MGLILKCKCKKCGYTFKAFVGIGMMYTKTYTETVIKMKEEGLYQFISETELSMVTEMPVSYGKK